MGDEVDFSHADKHESLLQIDTTNLIGMVKYSQSSQNRKFAMSLLFLKKNVEDEVDFLHVDKHTKVSHKLISTLWASKFA